jgi:hypothetical protein
MASEKAREAAAKWAKTNSRYAQAANILRGSYDMAPIVQAFAKFEAEIREECAKIVMTKRNLQYEIGCCDCGNVDSSDHKELLATAIRENNHD